MGTVQTAIITTLAALSLATGSTGATATVSTRQGDTMVMSETMVPERPYGEGSWNAKPLGEGKRALPPINLGTETSERL